MKFKNDKIVLILIAIFSIFYIVLFVNTREQSQVAREWNQEKLETKEETLNEFQINKLDEVTFGATVFSDDFTRSNSNTVGNSWTETETGAGGCSISSNTAKIGTTDAGINIYQSQGSPTFPVTLKTVVSGASGSGRWHGSGIFGTGSGYTYLGWLASLGTNSANNIGIWNGSSWGAQIQKNLTTYPYYVWVDYTVNGSNYDVALYFSTTDSKPGTPDATATMAKPAGTNIQAMFDSDSTSKYVQYDSIILTDASAEPAVNVRHDPIIWFD